jgi:hypothetical protein
LCDTTQVFAAASGRKREIDGERRIVPSAGSPHWHSDEAAAEEVGRDHREAARRQA